MPEQVTLHIEDDHGNEICAGLGEDESAQVAQDWADRLEKRVWLYCDQDDETGPVAFTPSR